MKFSKVELFSRIPKFDCPQRSMHVITTSKGDTFCICYDKFTQHCHITNEVGRSIAWL